MKEIKKEELRNIQIRILQHVDEFCTKHNLRYFISGGTLIGAIRHKGFIPWDDDIDFMMLREDYERFIKLYSQEDNSIYHLYSHKILPSYPYPFAKIDDSRTIMHEEINDAIELGVNIDIFPIDIAPKTEREQERIVRQNRRLINILTAKRLPVKKGRGIKKNTLLFLLQLIFYPYSTRKIIDRIDRNAQCLAGFPTGKRGCLVWGYGKKEIIDESNYSESIYVDFENHKFATLSGWHNYLTSLFGDYMKLPPEEKRITHHHFTAYWK